ncbi:MAG: putative rane protein [Acidimicrobiales bacterium]|nr:putative rane protein [Acidimicrobiales bacterium]
MALPLRDDEATRRFPWVTVLLIIVNVVVFLFVQPSAYQNPPRQSDHSFEAVRRSNERAVFAYKWGTVPCEIASGSERITQPADCPRRDGAPLPAHKAVYLTLLTSMFIHASLLHIGGNMLFLWVFGNNVEDRLGRLGFLVFYLVGGVVADLGYVASKLHSGGPAFGASGAIAAAMGAYLVFHPRGKVLTALYAGTVQLVYLPAAVVLGLFFVTQFFTPDKGVAWQAHAVGMGFGFVAALALTRLPSVRRRAEAHDADAALRTWAAF